ncbi:hypothetical protein P4050_15980 [Pseudomonas aeruginosa]|nr:hypothetical protein [Pseudomonas aeruginosa]
MDPAEAGPPCRGKHRDADAQRWKKFQAEAEQRGLKQPRNREQCLEEMCGNGMSEQLEQRIRDILLGKPDGHARNVR